MKNFLIACGLMALPFVWNDQVYAFHDTDFWPIASQTIGVADAASNFSYWEGLKTNEYDAVDPFSRIWLY